MIGTLRCRPESLLFVLGRSIVQNKTALRSVICEPNGGTCVFVCTNGRLSRAIVVLCYLVVLVRLLLRECTLVSHAIENIETRFLLHWFIGSLCLSLLRRSRAMVNLFCILFTSLRRTDWGVKNRCFDHYKRKRKRNAWLQFLPQKIVNQFSSFCKPNGT